VAWIEAVTANPVIAYNHVNARPSVTPTAREEIFFGPAALRFAKTLGNKLNCGYERLPHVTGYPFAIAIADFQAPASMLWSREGLIGYLYGEGAQEADIDGRKKAVPMTATHLLGHPSFPVGLFADDEHAHLSAVIFSNACSIAKLNRVAVSGCGAPAGLRYMRIGNFFDRTPGALKGIPFCLDITSEAYRQLWPQGYEPWSAELEVFLSRAIQFRLSLYRKRRIGSRRTESVCVAASMRPLFCGRKHGFSAKKRRRCDWKILLPEALRKRKRPVRNLYTFSDKFAAVRDRISVTTRRLLSKGAALARARVRTPSAPVGPVSPTFRAFPDPCLLIVPIACAGRVIPLRPGRPCPCYPGLADGQGGSAALR
jgi:hypothetical protein